MVGMMSGVMMGMTSGMTGGLMVGMTSGMMVGMMRRDSIPYHRIIMTYLDATSYTVLSSFQIRNVSPRSFGAQQCDPLFLAAYYRLPANGPLALDQSVFLAFLIH